MGDMIDRDAALAVLRKAQIASCTCQIKTPDPEWHSNNCRYRVFREAEAMIDHLPDALPAVTPKVKPLVWEPSVIDKPWHSAKAPWGWYYAQWDDETQAWFASLEMGEVEAPIILSPSDVPSIEAAKAAAQADYEARVLAALPAVTQPDPADEYPYDAVEQCERDLDGIDPAAIREAALREAADLVNRRVDGVRVSIPCPDGKSGCLVHHFRIEDGPTAKAILALITEKPHDRA